MVKEFEELLAVQAEKIASDMRPAGFAENAKPIISEPGELPRLREYMGLPDTVATN